MNSFAKSDPSLEVESTQIRPTKRHPNVLEELFVSSEKGGALNSNTQQRRRGRAVLLSLAVLVGVACGDDTTVTTAGPEDTESTTGGSGPSTITITTVDPTEGTTTTGVDSTDSATTADTTTTGDDTTTTGGEVIPGQTINQLVSSGERTASDNYTLVYTFGQPSQLQSSHDSANYHIRGGLIGANGSPP